jgi:hypothetical protein
VAPANALPGRDCGGRAGQSLVEERSVPGVVRLVVPGRRMRGVNLRIVPRKDVVCKRADQGLVPARSRQLKRPKPHERGSHPAHDRTRLVCRPPIVKLVPQDGRAGRHQAQRARRADAERRHGLAHHVFPHAGPQDGPAVGEAGVGRPARALQLELDARADQGGGAVGRVRAGHGHVAQADGPAVAQLAGPGPELVAAVAGGVRAGAGQRGRAGKDRRELRAARFGRVEAERGQDGPRRGERARVGRRRRRRRVHERVGRALDLAGAVGGVRVGG